MQRPTGFVKVAIATVTFLIGAAAVSIYVHDRWSSRSPEKVAPNEVAELRDDDAFPQPTPTPENITLKDKSPTYLCDHLADMKHMAWSRYDHSGDAVYDALNHNAYYAIPCLVDKITDTREMDDPSGAPGWAGYKFRVGDTAVLMLMVIHSDWAHSDDAFWPKGMMPPKYEKLFETEGRFAYFFYVDEVPNARKQVQRFWRSWMKTCQPDCAALELLDSKH